VRSCNKQRPRSIVWSPVECDGFSTGPLPAVDCRYRPLAALASRGRSPDAPLLPQARLQAAQAHPAAPVDGLGPLDPLDGALGLAVGVEVDPRRVPTGREARPRTGPEDPFAALHPSDVRPRSALLGTWTAQELRGVPLARVDGVPALAVPGTRSGARHRRRRRNGSSGLARPTRRPRSRAPPDRRSAR
jgi:hypothetical protein